MGHHDLPKHSLKAMAPVSLREEGDYSAGNAVGFITADLATNIVDPEKRLRAIQLSMRAGKDLLKGLSPREAMIFMQLTQVPALLTTALGLAAQFPAFSTVISNVPGPRQELYWNGARMDGIYPASIVFDGFAMNITLVSYAKSLDFGIVACRRSLPEVQRMIDYLEEALVELEDVVGLRARRPQKVAKGKSGFTAKATVKEDAKKASKKAAKRIVPKRAVPMKATTSSSASALQKTKPKIATKVTPRLKRKLQPKVQPKLKAKLKASTKKRRN